MSEYVYFKCDRCGKKEERAETVSSRRLFRWFRFLRHETASRDYDLCMHCSKAFDKWLTSAEATR